MKLDEILPKLLNKECKYIYSESLSMYNQKPKSIKKWLTVANFYFFKEIVNATDWEVQDFKLYDPKSKGKK